MESLSSARSKIQKLKAQLPQCYGPHVFSLRRALEQLAHKTEVEQITGKLFDVSQRIEQSMAMKQSRQENLPKVEYPSLPVSEKRDDIAQAILNHQVVIVAGETGSGKTTQLPKICLEVGRGVNGIIGHTQPRRLAARTVANRIAEELKSQIGNAVGFKIRFSDQVSEQTYVKLMTDGILLAEIQSDRYLNQYDTIIIDEAHERSLNIDFILGYLKRLLPKRPDLKVIITSATIDPERFSRHFDDAPIIQVSGRTYPVEVRYRPLLDEEADLDQSEAIVAAVRELDKESRGDILVFLSGEREIRDTADALNQAKLKGTEVLPLYARLSAAEQNRIFAPHGLRRIVLATNVAETSLTVPGIKYVIDPGFARISRYSYRSKVQRLPIEAISQASANQRAGRCGRVSNGICIRLYSEEDFLARPEFTDPEILRTNLASVILQMLSLGLGDIGLFPFVQPPDNRFINDGFRLLEELQATEKRRGRMSLTSLGKQIARLPVDPRYARMVIEGAKRDSLKEVIVIAAGLSIQDPRERPQDKRQKADEQHEAFADKSSDFLSLLNLWREFSLEQKRSSQNQLRKWCKSRFINYLRMREWQDIVSQLKKAIVELGFRLNSQEADYQQIHTALLSGLLSHIGNKDKEREFIGARNSRFMIFPGSSLAKKPPKWTMVAELVETTRLFGRVAAKIEPEWIEPIATHLTKHSFSEPHWSKKRGAVQGYEQVVLFGLPIVAKRLVDYARVDAHLCHELLIREGLIQGQTKLNLPFLQQNLAMIERVQELEEMSRRRDILVDEEQMLDFYQELIPEHVVSEASLMKWYRKLDSHFKQRLIFDPDSLKKHDADSVNEFNFPKIWQQGNIKLKLQYQFEPNAADDGVSALIPLALLNQVEEVGFDWLVPGFRHDLIVALIRSLPKRLRRNFVPAPNFAQACIADMPTHDKKGHPLGFVESLSEKLFKMTGVKVDSHEWQLESIEEHLKFNFIIIDENQKILKQGRDLHSLKMTLQGKVKQTLRKVAKPGIEKENITEWDFPELQKEYLDKSSGFEVKAFPALVDQSQSVAIKLFDSADAAHWHHKIGLRKLIRLNIPSPIKYLQEKLPNKAKLGLYFNPFGQIKALIDDCIDAAVDDLLAGFSQSNRVEIRDRASFDLAREYVREHLNDTVLQIATKVEQGLTTAHGIQKRLKGNVPLNLISAHGDIKQHLSSLVFGGFVAQLGAKKLDDWNRYIKAIERRLEKLPIDPNKDRLHQLNIEKIQSQYQDRLNKIPKGKLVPEDLLAVRWMIEELRVSFFAQQLGTPMPISIKRIENVLAAF